MALAQAVTWSFLADVASKAIQPVVFVVLARFLSPEEFGILAAAMMVIGFSQIFWEAGMSKALIQRQTEVDIAANVAFGVNLLLAFTVCSLLYLGSDRIADLFFHDDRVSTVLKVMTVQVLLAALSAVHVALLQKNMDFRKLFWVRLATVSLPGVASIPLAWAGFSYWSLVAGTIVGHLAQLIVLWSTSDWRPSARYSPVVARELVTFGAWVAAAGLLAWFYSWGDSLVVGLFLGSHDLGLYRTGNQLAIMVFGFIFGPCVPVLYSYLSSKRGDLGEIATVSTIVIKSLVVLAIPLAVIAFSLSGTVERTVFPSQWSGIGLVLGIMSLTHGFAWIVGMNGEIYRASGAPKYETYVPAATLILYLAVYLVAIQYGLTTFLWSRFALALAGIMLHFALFRYLVKRPLAPMLGFAAIVLTVTVLEVWAIKTLIFATIISEWARLIVGGGVAVAAVAVTLYAIERRGFVRELRLIFERPRAA